MIIPRVYMRVKGGLEMLKNSKKKMIKEGKKKENEIKKKKTISFFYFLF